MSYVKTWTFLDNQTPLDQTTATKQAQSFFWQIYSFLIGNGWTDVGNNNWGSAAALTISTGAHSWVILKSPVGIVAGANGSYTGDQSRVFLTIDLNSVAVYCNVRFGLHRVLPSGGTTTVGPASTDQIGYFSNLQFLRSSLVAAKFHFRITSEGSFSIFCSYPGSGYMSFALMLLPVTSIAHATAGTYAGNDYPYGLGFYAGYVDSGIGVLSPNSPGIFYASGGVLCWAADGTAGVANLTPFSNNQLQSFGYNAASDFFTGNALSQDMRLQCVTAGKAADIGTIADHQGTCAGTAQNSTDNATPTKQFLGRMWVPVAALLSV